MISNIYTKLTSEFNKDKVRVIICSGQALVLHQLAIVSKDGDWIVKEDDESLNFIINVLQKHNAKYRFGAPLDQRWMKEGWSSHFEFNLDGFRVRTDFFTRPPRISKELLAEVWKTAEAQEIPFIGLESLALMKQTDRERDYVIIGDLSRRFAKLEQQVLFSRSARDLIEIENTNPDLIESLIIKRPVLKFIKLGRDELEQALDKEKRMIMRENESRLAKYEKASEEWRSKWLEINNKYQGLKLEEMHAIITNEAVNYLPFKV